MSIHRQRYLVRRYLTHDARYAQCDAILGDLLPSSYKDNIASFNDQFRKAVEIFEGKLRMDQYQLVVGIGWPLSRWQSSLSSLIPRSTGHSSAETWRGRLGILEIRLRMS